MRESATYQDTQKWVQQEFGLKPKTCWIAHCKEIYRLQLIAAPNRQGEEPTYLGSSEKRPAIKKAFQHFGSLV